MPEIHLHHIHPELRARAKELRHPLTSEEQKIWSRVRNRQLGGYKFRRQVPLGPFIVDFYCPEAHLVIEIDGEIHKFQQGSDFYRSAWLEEQGLTVIRFTNQEVDENIEEVFRSILAKCRA